MEITWERLKSDWTDNKRKYEITKDLLYNAQSFLIKVDEHMQREIIFSEMDCIM